MLSSQNVLLRHKTMRSYAESKIFSAAAPQSEGKLSTRSHVIDSSIVRTLSSQARLLRPHTAILRAGTREYHELANFGAIFQVNSLKLLLFVENAILKIVRLESSSPRSANNTAPLIRARSPFRSRKAMKAWNESRTFG